MFENKALMQYMLLHLQNDFHKNLFFPLGKKQKTQLVMNLQESPFLGISSGFFSST